MSEIIILTLQITLVGMGLVFGAILLLWALMALLVRLARDGEAPSLPVQAALESEAAEPDALHAETERCRRAAAAAVAIALAFELDQVPHAFPPPPATAVSPWQTVRRADRLKRRGRTR